MMLFSNNISNRLKAVYRFCGDTDKLNKRPHISFLEGLPVELLQFIASYLPLSAAASFALIKQMILYRSSLSNYYHLVLVVGGWSSRKWENLQKIGGFYRSATIHNMQV